MSSSFPQTRSQALSLENQTESLLNRYAVFAQANTGTANDEELGLEKQIDELLHKREDVIAVLNRASKLETNLPASKLQQLQRHREILGEHWSNFGRLKNSIKQERNRLNLLFSVRSDIEAHKQRTQRLNAEGNGLSEEGYMLDERVRADNANSLADRLLAQAAETRDELFRQRSYLNNAQSKIYSLLQTVPGVNTLISKINSRKKRDTLILASVISVCIILLFFL